MSFPGTKYRAARRPPVALLCALAVASLNPSVLFAAVAEIGPGRCESAPGDATTTTAVQSRLRWNAALDAADIQVSTAAGQVELRGLARNEAQKALAGRVALETYGVAALSNQLDVNDWTPRTVGASKEAQARREQRLTAKTPSDEWVTAAVSYSLSFFRDLDNCAILVSTREGRVSLRGTVASQPVRAAMVASVEEIIGVKSVDATGLALK